jgi:hypothetical protein
MWILLLAEFDGEFDVVDCGVEGIAFLQFL